MGSRPRFAIAADSPLTVAAGVAVAEAGGNAIDVAVACALSASMAEVLMASLGGSAFVMLQKPGSPAECIDGADRVPLDPWAASDAAVSWDVHLPYGDGISVRAGPASVAVPGMLAALELAWQRHGRLPWPEVVAPALELARSGFPLGRTTAIWLGIAGPLLFHRQEASRLCFCPDPADPPVEGRHFRIPGMDDTLALIAAEGAAAFYEGDIAAAFAATMAAAGGLVRRSDLAAYRAVVRRPLPLNSRGFTLALNPPPAVGGSALGTLIRLLEQAHSSGSAAEPAAQRVHQLAHAQLKLFRLRRAGALRSPHTTHLSVAGNDGSLVAITLSNGYGSGITIPGTGIACNNSLGEPELNPGGFLAAPGGSRLASNMAPTLARHPDGRAYALGSPGASRITTALAQVWQRLTQEGLDPAAALAAPRLHVNSEREPPLLLCEPGLDCRLVEPEFEIRRYEQPDMFFGGVKLAGLGADGSLLACADERRHGAIALVP